MLRCVKKKKKKEKQNHKIRNSSCSLAYFSSLTLPSILFGLYLVFGLDNGCFWPCCSVSGGGVNFDPFLLPSFLPFSLCLLAELCSVVGVLVLHDSFAYVKKLNLNYPSFMILCFDLFSPQHFILNS